MYTTPKTPAPKKENFFVLKIKANYQPHHALYSEDVILAIIIIERGDVIAKDLIQATGELHSLRVLQVIREL